MAVGSEGDLACRSSLPYCISTFIVSHVILLSSLPHTALSSQLPAPPPARTASPPEPVSRKRDHVVVALELHRRAGLVSIWVGQHIAIGMAAKAVRPLGSRTHLHEDLPGHPDDRSCRDHPARCEKGTVLEQESLPFLEALLSFNTSAQNHGQFSGTQPQL